MAVVYGKADSEKQLLSKYPNRVKKIEDIETVYQEIKRELRVPHKGLFGGIKKWHKKRQASTFEKNKNSPFHAGARGELQTLKKLSGLPPGYHVLCGVNIELPNYITYNGQRNLKSAQMDFVVVSKRGVVLIEVKNWSMQYYRQHTSLAPHEQVDRASRILWVALKSWRRPKDISVKGVVLSIQGNIHYDPRYKFVSVSDLNGINDFIQNRKVEFTTKEVKRIVGRLKGHVTK